VLVRSFLAWWEPASRCSTRRVPMIEACGLSKMYGDKTAVDDLSFTVRPGVVTGLLGPNGAGSPRRCG
jgi:ABC-type phosphonate transport system ATPase subunit